VNGARVVAASLFAVEFDLRQRNLVLAIGFLDGAGGDHAGGRGADVFVEVQGNAVALRVVDGGLAAVLDPDRRLAFLRFREVAFCAETFALERFLVGVGSGRGGGPQAQRGQRGDGGEDRFHEMSFFWFVDDGGFRFDPGQRHEQSERTWFLVLGASATVDYAM
jgi:hypothetical protein